MICAAKDTERAWKSLNAEHRARSLVATRFISFRNGESGDEWRRESCLAIQKGKVLREKLEAWRQFLARLPKPVRALHGRLQSRLILNASGGAMENGGMCLDRNTGLPFIPGGAVKGCARRAALTVLREWITNSGKPTEPTSFTEIRHKLSTYEDLLCNIALMFGWVQFDWDSGRKPSGEFHSDLRFACGEDAWPQVRHAVAETLLGRFPHVRREHRDKPWKDLPNFAGTISFLPAFPLEKDPGIDLDVITCHHREYYNENPVYNDAPDTEEPVPIIFPCVSATQRPIFTFPLVTLSNSRLASAEASYLLETASQFLRAGLEAFGIGGKTSAGYGWLDCSPDVQESAKELLERINKEAESRREREEHERKDQEQRAAAAALRAATAKMTDEQKADYAVAQLNEAQFQGRLDDFLKRDPKEQEAMVRALRLDPAAPRSRRAFWESLKAKAQKGQPARIADEIRHVCKRMNLGKMP